MSNEARNTAATRRSLSRLGLRLFHILTSLNPWHFLWISFVLSEVLTACMGLILKGRITWDYLVTGGVVSFIVAGLVIFLLQLMMQIRLDNEKLLAEIDRQREEAQGLSSDLDFHSLLMETIPDLLYVLNPAGTLIKWNTKAEEMTGYTGKEIEGRHALDFIAQEDREDAQEGLQEAYEKGSATRTLRLLRKDGTKNDFVFNGGAIRDREGKFVGFVGIGRDVSSLKKMEQEIQRAQRLEALGILAGGIAHDFDNLITTVLENIHLAAIHADQRDAQGKNLRAVQSASAKAKVLTNKLLVFSRGGLPVKTRVYVGKIAREFAENLTANSGIGCEFDLADSWEVEVDNGQIGQVISNIVVNAIDAMPRGGMISVSTRNAPVALELPPLPAGKYVRLSIADQGAGISQELLQKVFDPYFTTKQSSGGMGLAISYAIVRNHGGHIRAESEPGKGSVFEIYLPAANR